MEEDDRVAWLAADTFALCVPFVAFLYAFIPFGRMNRPTDVLNWFHASSVLSICGFLCGLIAPARVRLNIAMGGLITGCIILSIPIGVLRPPPSAPASRAFLHANLGDGCSAPATSHVKPETG